MFTLSSTNELNGRHFVVSRTLVLCHVFTIPYAYIWRKHDTKLNFIHTCQVSCLKARFWLRLLIWYISSLMIPHLRVFILAIIDEVPSSSAVSLLPLLFHGCHLWCFVSTSIVLWLFIIIFMTTFKYHKSEQQHISVAFE